VKKLRTNSKNEAGFTLVELMVVIVLIGILASIGLEYVQGSIDKTRINTDISQGRIIKNSLDMFYSKNGRLPADITELVDAGLLRPVTTAQKVGGTSILIDDTNYETNPILKVSQTSGNVQVYNVNDGALMWESGSI
jgi:prepilin-type N-terminal cleavage/methylation domain-containing protein